MRKREKGGMLGGTEREVETECPLRTAVAEQTDRWAKGPVVAGKPCGGEYRMN